MSADPASDQDAAAVLETERACQVIEILASHAPLFDVTGDRIAEALVTIRAALKLLAPGSETKIA